MRVDKLLYLTKVGWVTLLYHVGILRLLKRVLLRNRAVVLMYHRVLDDDEVARSFSHPGIIVKRATFAMHLDLLRRWFRVVTLDQFIERLQRRESFESATCLITFDDGWFDNFQNGLPLLQRYGLPATIFVPTIYIGTGRSFWRERAAAVLGAAALAKDQEGRKLLQSLGLPSLDTVPKDERLAAIQQFLNGMKARSIEDKEQVMAAIDAFAERISSGETNVDRFIDWPQARIMVEQGITFGAHGHTHHLFDQIEPAAVDEEVRLSRTIIERELDRPVRALSYPNGNHDRQVAEIVKEAGYATAFSVQSGRVTAEDDPYTVRRVSIHEDMTRSPALFLARILGVI